MEEGKDSVLLSDTLAQIESQAESEPKDEVFESDNSNNEQTESTEVKDQKQPLGKGPKAVILVIVGVIGYQTFNNITSVAEQVPPPQPVVKQAEDLSKETDQSMTKEQTEAKKEPSTTQVNAGNSTVDNVQADILSIDKEDINSEFEAFSAQSKKPAAKNIGIKIDQELDTDLSASFELDTSGLDESSTDQEIELISELEDLNDYPNYGTDDADIKMGSVVSEEDINKINNKISALQGQIKTLEGITHDQSQKIVILESEVTKKSYDLSFEKDRPQISELIISRATQNCEQCVSHASWMYQGIEIQKSDNSKWMGFEVNLLGDKLELSKGSDISYEYWSTHKGY